MYLRGSAMAAAGVQMSDVTRPVRAKLRHLYYAPASASRSDMAGSLYSRPATTATEQLALAAPERWPELLGADTDAAAIAAARPPPPYHAPCALVPAGVAPVSDQAEATTALPAALEGNYFGLPARARPAPAPPAAPAPPVPVRLSECLFLL